MNTIIVAEIGSNWNGTITHFKEMIYTAKKCGASLAKGQIFSKEFVENGDYDNETKSYLLQRVLTPDNVKELVNYGKSINIPVFFSVFGLDELKIAVNAGVDYIKIREPDSYNDEIVLPVMATDKKVFISATVLPNDPQKAFHPRVTWMYCPPADISKRYPPVLADLNLAMIQSGWGGYSNHFPDPLPCILAVVLGARVIETHLYPETPSGTLGYLPIDNKVSLRPDQFQEMVEGIKMVETLGLAPKDEELF